MNTGNQDPLIQISDFLNRKFPDIIDFGYHSRYWKPEDKGEPRVDSRLSLSQIYDYALSSAQGLKMKDPITTAIQYTDREYLSKLNQVYEEYAQSGCIGCTRFENIICEEDGWGYEQICPGCRQPLLPDFDQLENAVQFMLERDRKKCLFYMMNLFGELHELLAEDVLEFRTVQKDHRAEELTYSKMYEAYTALKTSYAAEAELFSNSDLITRAKEIVKFVDSGHPYILMDANNIFLELQEMNFDLLCLRFLSGQEILCERIIVKGESKAKQNFDRLEFMLTVSEMLDDEQADSLHIFGQRKQCNGDNWDLSVAAADIKPGREHRLFSVDVKQIEFENSGNYPGKLEAFQLQSIPCSVTE